MAAAVLAILGVAAEATAQSAPPEPPEQSFELGRAALRAGDYDVACAHFQASLEAEETPGVRLNLGYCEEKRGQPAAAWRQYQRALELLPADDPRRAATTQRQARLEESSLAVIVLVAGSNAQELRAWIDGEPGAIGERYGLDPGEHRVSYAPVGDDSSIRELKVALLAGENARIVLEAKAEPIAQKTTPEAKPQLARAPGAARTGRLPGATETNDGWLQRGLGIATAGVGLTLAAVGAGYGYQALHKRAESDERCPLVDGLERCTATGVALKEEAKDAALRADVLLGVGAGVAALGIIVIVTSPSASAKPAQRSSHAIRIVPTIGGASIGVDL